MSADVRYAILGGGCAGLSLAVELAERGLAAGGVAVVEPRREFRQDRTWCSWSLAPHRFQDLEVRRWSRWRLRRGGRSHVHRSRRHHYAEIPSAAFYERALARLAGRPGVDLHLGTAAEGVCDSSPGPVRIRTSAGELRAEHVFDARPAPPAGHPPELLQHFLGLRIRTAEPLFDPDVVTLMDFDVPQDDGIHFVYTLPADAHTALVESTFLSQRPLAAERYRAEIERYLDERYGVRKFDVVEAERGVIPMSSARPVPLASPRVMRLGTAAGLVRPSTGYAFLAIQRFTRSLVDGLARGHFEAPVLRPRSLRAMDAIFLHHLRAHPGQAPALFERLFARVEPDTLVRFLGDVPSAADRLAVVRAMPKAPFLASAWRSRRRWSAA